MKFIILVSFFIVTVLTEANARLTDRFTKLKGTLSPPTVKPGVCKDDEYRCANLQKLNYCTRNKKYMYLNCKKSCNKCHCVDTLRDCANYQGRKLCDKVALVAKNCRYSCETCDADLKQILTKIESNKEKDSNADLIKQFWATLTFQSKLSSSKCVKDKTRNQLIDHQCVTIRAKLDCIPSLHGDNISKTIQTDENINEYLSRNCNKIIAFLNKVVSCYDKKKIDGNCGKQRAVFTCASSAYTSIPGQEVLRITSQVTKTKETCIADVKALKKEWVDCERSVQDCRDVIGCFLEADSKSNITNVKTIQHPKAFTICRDKAELALLREEWHTCMVQHKNSDCRNIMTCYDDASEKKKEEVKDVVTFDRTQEYYKKYLQCQDQRDIENFRKEWKKCISDDTSKDCTKVENCFNEAKRHSRITNGNHKTFNMLKAEMDVQKKACKVLGSPKFYNKWQQCMVKKTDKKQCRNIFSCLIETRSLPEFKPNNKETRKLIPKYQSMLQECKKTSGK